MLNSAKFPATQNEFHLKILRPLLAMAITGLLVMAPGFAKQARPDAAENQVSDTATAITHGHITLNSHNHKARSYAFIRQQENDIVFMGDDKDLNAATRLKHKISGDFLWLRDGDKSWVIQDKEVLEKIAAAWSPADKLSQQMDKLSAEMDLHSKELDSLSDQIDQLNDGAEQYSDELDSLSEKLSDLADQQSDLADQMSTIGEDIANANSPSERARLDSRLSQLQSKMTQLEQQIKPLTQAMEVQGQMQEQAQKPIETLAQQMEEASKPLEKLDKRMEQLTTAAEHDTLALADEALRANKGILTSKL